jgi:hypothetical protein
MKMSRVLSERTPGIIALGSAALWLALGCSVAGETPPGSPLPGKDRPFWAFQKLAHPPIPAVKQTDLVRGPVDAFLLAKLEAKALSFSPPAEGETLVRRAFLDLIGLPPSPEDVAEFVNDRRPDAYERLLDRLLGSPHFGERWARHWLDVVGYADTVGFDIDATLIIQSEGKWRYRDYVVNAFNKDMPYDAFVREQIAGDEMVDWRRAKAFTPEVRDKLIATGYLRNARDETHEPESNIPLIYYGVLHNTLDIVGSSLLGLTLQCARCHDHKFDPIGQKEYYQLMAFFTPAYNPNNWRAVYPWKPEVKDRSLPDVSPAEQADIERHNREIVRQALRAGRRLADLRWPYEARLLEEKYARLPEPIRADTRAAILVPPAKRNEIQKYLAGKFEQSLKVTSAEVSGALSAADRQTAEQLGKELAALTKQQRSWGKIQALFDVGPPPATHFLRRGNHESPRGEVQPGLIQVLMDAENPVVIPAPAPPGSSGRRLALAQWLTQPDSPASALLARVLVNRLWQHLFGEGLVATPENFGHSGEPPSHPELLEWLAGEFRRQGWQIKPMIKLLMTSTAYRQTSRPLPNPAAEKMDPGNKLLWKMRLRRLEAEAIRDGILTVSGQFDTSMGGPPVLIKFLPDGMVVIDESKLPQPTAKNRRSIYLLARRAYNFSLLTVFDQPLVAVNCPRRDVSAVPLQSLAMMNDAVVAEQARHFAGRILRLSGGAREECVRLAFRLALARAPSAAEEGIGLRLLEEQARLFMAAKTPAAEAEEKALVQLCHVLLNTSEFLYVE